jgi:hypothetical protein
MYRQSIVDFFKDGKVATEEPALAPAPAPEPGLVALAVPVKSLEAERAYVELGKPVLDALSASNQMSERDLYRATHADDFPMFQSAMCEMQSRGLVQVVGYEKPFNDPIYKLSLPAT